MLILLKKEFYEIIRDKRSIMSALLYSLMGPILMMLIFESLIKQERDEDSLSVNLYAKTNAQSETESNNLHKSLMHLNEFLTYKKTRTQVVTQTNLSDWSDKQAIVELGHKILASGKKRLLLTVYINPDQDALYKNGQKIIELIREYQRSQSFVEGLRNGVVLYTHPFEINVHKTSHIDPRGRHLLLVLLMFILLAPFFSSLNVANDTTAGERERGTLTDLLIQPVDTINIALAKWLGACLMGVSGTLITLSLTAWVTQTLPLYELGIHLHIEMIDWVLAGIILIPYACFATGLQMWVALYAKNYKEGQNYLMLLSFVPMMLIFAKQFSMINIDQTWLPLIGHEWLIDQLLNGQNFSISEALLPALSSLLLTAALIYMVKRKFQSETILSGT